MMEILLIVGGSVVVMVVLGFLAVSLLASRSRNRLLNEGVLTLQQKLEDQERLTRAAEYKARLAEDQNALTVKSSERFWAGGPISHTLKTVLEVLEGWKLDEDKAPKPFSKRLAEENGWNEEFTAAAIIEYKRFLALYLTTGITVTPSKVVDEVWHLHLQYTLNYWSLCRKLGAAIHHCPSRGDEIDESKYQQAFVETLACYQVAFQASPPVSIWGEVPAGVQAAIAEQQRKVDAKIEEEKQKKRRSRETVENPYLRDGCAANSDAFLFNFLLWHTVVSSPAQAAASEHSPSGSSPTVGVPMDTTHVSSFIAPPSESSGGGGSSSSGYSGDSGGTGSSFGGFSSGGGFSSCGGGGFSSCGGGGSAASCGGGGM